MQKPGPSPPHALVLDFFVAREQKVGECRGSVSRGLDAHARWSQGRRRDAHARQRRDTTTVMVRPPAIARSAPVLIAVVVGHQQRAWRRQERRAHTRLVACSRCRRSPDDHARLPRAPRRRYTLDANARVWYVSRTTGTQSTSHRAVATPPSPRRRALQTCAAPARAGRRTGAGGERARAAVPAAPPRGRLRGAALPPLRRRPAPSARCCPCTLASKRAQVPRVRPNRKRVARVDRRGSPLISLLERGLLKKDRRRTLTTGPPGVTKVAAHTKQS